jgi:hypothetical protein
MGVVLGTTLASAQVNQLRGPPLSQRPAPTILTIGGLNGSPSTSVTIQPRVQLMPAKQPPVPLDNGGGLPGPSQITPWFVWNISPGNLGGNSGGFGGGGGGLGGGGLSGGFGGLSNPGFAGFGGNFAGFGGAQGGFPGF